MRAINSIMVLECLNRHQIGYIMNIKCIISTTILAMVSLSFAKNITESVPYHITNHSKSEVTFQILTPHNKSFHQEIFEISADYDGSGATSNGVFKLTRNDGKKTPHFVIAQLYLDGTAVTKSRVSIMRYNPIHQLFCTISTDYDVQCRVT